MSIRLMAEVWRTNLPTVEKMVLLVIADHANDEGTQAYPAQVTIARKASISVRTVQRAVNSLVERGFIELHKHSGGSADCREDRRPNLYIINLHKLRGDNVTGRQDDGNGATMTTSTGRLSRPLNNPLEPSINHPGFDDFWKIYPLKVAKQAAKNAWVKTIVFVDPQVIIDGAKRYAADPNRNPAFTAHPATWIRAHRWLDEPLPAKPLTKEEQVEKDKRLAKERAERERQENEEFFRALAEQRARSVPMPEELKNTLRKL